MSGNSGDNWDLIAEIPGETGELPDHPGFEITDEGTLMARIRNFYDEGVGAWEENRRMHSEDLNFIYNSEAQGQWDPVVLQNRRGKPSYTFNRVIGPVNIVVGDMKQTRPSAKVRPASSGASEGVAEVLAGLCRSIEQASRADSIYKEQYKYAVAGGFGAWRIMPTYLEDDGEGAFDQVLRMVNISNPQTVVWDPQCSDPCAGDANRCIIAERISDEIYRAIYKNDGVSFNFSRDSYGWFTDKEVRIADYFERVPREKKIAQMTDGTVVDYDDDLRATESHMDKMGITWEKHGANRIARDKNGHQKIRTTIHWQVMWVKCDGTNILEGPYYYDWKRIPVVRCPGRYINIEGRKKFQSLIRHSKDAQRSYNSRASDMIERSALIPKAPYLVTATMIKGFENEWNQANTQSRPYLPYNVDPKAEGSGGMPHRMEPLDLPQGAIALAQMSIQDIQATIGFYDASVGNAEDANRVSGKALVQHNRRSDLGSYEFVDGFAAATQLTWEMYLDMIPETYDSERIERIIGQAGIEDMVTLNEHTDQVDEDGNDVILNDLKKGKYDVTVTLGSNYETARQESLDTLLGFAEALPESAAVISDLIAKNVDTPDAHEMARRLRIPLIQQGIVKPNEQEQKDGVGKPTPAQQAQQAMEQLNQRLMQAKTTKMEADSAIAGSRAQSSPQEQEKLKLGNMVLASKVHDAALGHAGIPDMAQARQDQMSNAQELQHQGNLNQQELAQNEAAHRQTLVHQHGEHIADVLKGRSEHEHAVGIDTSEHEKEERRLQEKHEREEARKVAAHRAEMERLAEKHKLELEHSTKLNEAKVTAAKAMAKAKPKAAKAA